MVKSEIRDMEFNIIKLKKKLKKSTNYLARTRLKKKIEKLEKILNWAKTD